MREAGGLSVGRVSGLRQGINAVGPACSGEGDWCNSVMIMTSFAEICKLCRGYIINMTGCQ